MLAPPIIRKVFLVFFSLGFLSAAGCTGQPTQADNSATQSTEIVGWVEKGKISDLDEEIKFKLDTGATTSSMNAEILEQPDEETESGGMIKFRFRDGEEVSKVYELPVARWVKIESRTQDYLRRPVVRMKMCVGDTWIEEEVNLADRDDFNYSVLVGRNFLKKGKLAVDSSQTFTSDPDCSTEENQQ